MTLQLCSYTSSFPRAWQTPETATPDQAFGGMLELQIGFCSVGEIRSSSDRLLKVWAETWSFSKVRAAILMKTNLSSVDTVIQPAVPHRSELLSILSKMHLHKLFTRNLVSGLFLLCLMTHWASLEDGPVSHYLRPTPQRK